MDIDLHVHARELSSCAVASEEEMIRSAIAEKLDAIVFTNHDRLVAPARLEALNARHPPFRVCGGIEVSLESEHVIVLGIHDAALEIGSQAVPPIRWDYPDLHRFVRERGGYLILCHPFRYRGEITIDVESHPPDAIEVHSRNTPAWAEERIRAVAARTGAALLSNSDAHRASSVGVHFNRLARDAAAMPEILAALRSGAFQPVMRGAPSGVV